MYIYICIYTYICIHMYNSITLSCCSKTLCRSLIHSPCFVLSHRDKHNDRERVRARESARKQERVRVRESERESGAERERSKRKCVCVLEEMRVYCVYEREDQGESIRMYTYIKI